VTETKVKAVAKPKGATPSTQRCDFGVVGSLEDIEDAEHEATISVQRAKCDRSLAEYQALLNDEDAPVCMVQVNSKVH
jgi:hypothetical protein